MFVLSRFSCVRLCVTLWNVAHQAPLSVGFSRQEYRSGLPFPSPRNLPDPGIEPVCLTSNLHWQTDSLPLGAPLVVQLLKNPSIMWEILVQSLGWEDPLEKGKAIHSTPCLSQSYVQCSNKSKRFNPNTDESPTHSTKPKKSDSQDDLTHDSFYMTSWKRLNCRSRKQIHDLF